MFVVCTAGRRHTQPAYPQKYVLTVIVLSDLRTLNLCRGLGLPVRAPDVWLLSVAADAQQAGWRVPERVRRWRCALPERCSRPWLPAEFHTCTQVGCNDAVADVQLGPADQLQQSDAAWRSISSKQQQRTEGFGSGFHDAIGAAT